MKIGIFKNSKKQSEEIEKIFLNKLSFFDYTLDNLNPDVVFIIGGDGALLRAIQHYINKIDDIIFVGINSGTLAYLYDYSVNDIDKVLSLFKTKELYVKEFPLVATKFLSQNFPYYFLGFNEIRIENPFFTLSCDIYIDDEFLERYKGSGLIVCTPIGSSAYNKSCGGSLIHPSLDAFEITGISPISNLCYRSLGCSIVLPSSSKITIKGNLKSVVVGYDHLFSTVDIDEMSIFMSNKKVKILSSKENTFIKNIKRSFIG